MPVVDPVAPGPGVPQNLGNPDFKLLDPLRGIAALSVFGAHLALFLRASGNDALGGYLSRLDVGVSIFLIMSAFLLYRPFAVARLNGAPRPAVVPYAVRRALRVVPAYWVALPIISLYFGYTYVFTPEGVVTYFGFLQIYRPDTVVGGIGQAWTVCVEVSFYAMLPLWAMGMRKLKASSRRRFLTSELGVLALVFVLSVAWKVVAFEDTPQILRYQAGSASPALYTLPAFLDMFALGMGLAVVSAATSGRELGSRALRLIDRRPWLPWVGAGVAYWLSGLGRGAAELTSSTGFVVHHLLNTLVALGLFLPAIFGHVNRGLLRRLLDNRALRFLGVVGYGFYLWHLAALRSLAEAGVIGEVGAVAYGVLGFALAILLASLSYYWVERHAVQLGRRLSRGKGAKRAIGPAPVSTSGERAG